MSTKAITAVLCTLFLLPSIARATDPPETLLTQRLLETPQLREEIIAAAGRAAPTGTGSEIAMALFRGDERIWTALEAELPRFLADRIPRERLEALAKSYGENPEREWNQSGEEIKTLVWSLMSGDSQLRKAIARSGCSAGLLSPNIDAAREKAGKTGTPFKAPPEFLEKIQPFLRPIDETCDCIMRHAEGAGEKLFSDQMPREESAALMVQLIQTGKCPDPFAAFR
jgi:hypothetical protein